MWDSGIRRTPDSVFSAARALVAKQRHQQELLSVPTLAAELGIHKSTLEAAIRTGRLRAQFSTRSVFGRPVRSVARRDGEQFRQAVYGRRHIPAVCEPLVQIPADYPDRLAGLRRRLCLTQAALAEQIGAAGKAVIYQWESRKRIPSPVFWEKVQQLIGDKTLATLGVGDTPSLFHIGQRPTATVLRRRRTVWNGRSTRSRWHAQSR